MYEIRKDINMRKVLKGRSKTYIADELEMNKATINLIFNRKLKTVYTTAFAITKLLDEKAEIKDYFIRKEK